MTKKDIGTLAFLFCLLVASSFGFLYSCSALVDKAGGVHGIAVSVGKEIKSIKKEINE